MPRSLQLFIVGLLVSLLLPPDPMLRSLHLSIVELPVSLLRSVLFVLLLIVGLVVSLLLLGTCAAGPTGLASHSAVQQLRAGAAAACVSARRQPSRCLGWRPPSDEPASCLRQSSVCVL